jgi:hypothetical protein
MAAPPRGTFSSRAFSAAYVVATAAPPRVRFAALYLLLGALWLANASTIAKAFERCLGVDCFILERECRFSLAFPGVGAMSLFLLRGHWRRLSQAREVLICLLILHFLLSSQDGLDMLILHALELLVLVECCSSSG